MKSYYMGYTIIKETGKNKYYVLQDQTLKADSMRNIKNLINQKTIREGQDKLMK